MKQLLFVLACAALFGCASSTPATYNQSAYSPAPGAPAFSPTMDAPHTMGQPGYVQPGIQVEPGPRSKRVLPQTEETRRQAGLWASDRPGDAAEPIGVLLGVALPYPQSAETAAEKEPTNLCARVMGAEVRKAVAEKALDALGGQSRRCLAARLYAYCADLLTENDFAMIHALVSYDREWTRALREAYGPALMFASNECAKITADDKRTIDDMVRRTHNQWMSTIKAWGGK